MLQDLLNGDSISLLQSLILLILVLASWKVFRPRRNGSFFKYREADRPTGLRSPRKSKKEGPLLLEGFRMEGTPHEILGITEDASEFEIQKAYKKLVKRYHPDKVAAPDTPDWYHAQKITQILNEAKNEMLKKK